MKANRIFLLGCFVFLYSAVSMAAGPDSLAKQDSSALQKKPGAPRKINTACMTLKNGDGVTASDAELLTDRMNAELFKTGIVNILERAQMTEILKEQGFQQSGACTDNECIVQMGQLLGVEMMVYGSVGQMGSMYLVNLRAIDVATGQMKNVVSEDIPGTIEDVVDNLRNIVRQLVGLEKEAVVKRVHPARAAPVLEQKPAKEVVVKKPNANAALLRVKSTPDSAKLFLNSRFAGQTPYENVNMLPGQYTAKLVAPRCEDWQSDAFTLSKGETKEILADLVYKFSVLNLQSTPPGASVFLNSTKAGVTPYINDSLLPGSYALKLELPGHGPVLENLELLKNKRDTLSFTLYTKGFLDSANAQKRALAKRKKLPWQILFGVLAAGTGGTGVFLNEEVKKSLDNEKTSWNAYNSARLQAAIDSNYTVYKNNVTKTDAAMLRRNIVYGAAGVFTFVFALTLVY
jgi:TolB-like protein